LFLSFNEVPGSGFWLPGSEVRGAGYEVRGREFRGQNVAGRKPTLPGEPKNKWQ